MYKDNRSIDNALEGDSISFNIEGNFKVHDSLVKTSDVLLNNQISELLKNNRKVDINIKLTCLLNNKIKLEVDDIEIYSEEVVESSIKSPIDKQKIIEQISKLGNTVYRAKTEVIMDDNIFIRINTLNELKRKMIESLDNKRRYIIPYVKKDYTCLVDEIKEEQGFNILLHNEEDYNLIKDKKIKNIYLEESLYNKIEDNRKILKISRVINKHEEHNEELLVGELGSVNKYKNIITDYSLNVVNSYSVAFLHSLGVKRVTLSYELKKYQIKDIVDSYKLRYKKNPNLELIVSSIPEVMISKFNLLQYFKINNAYLLDSFNNKYKIEQENNIMKIYHYKKITEDDYSEYFKLGINTLRIHIEDKEDITKLNNIMM